MKIIRNCLTGLALTLFSIHLAHACKVQVVFPEHLNAEYASQYYVVSVLGKPDDEFLVRIDQAFGGRHAQGANVKLRLKANEEAHAICANIPQVGRTYLIRTTMEFDGLEISRFSWMNISDTDAKFSRYVADLVAAQAGQQQVPVDASRRH